MVPAMRKLAALAAAAATVVAALWLRIAPELLVALGFGALLVGHAASLIGAKRAGR